MGEKRVFVDRRQGADRRTDPDPCRHLPMDLYHRKRRKSKDRRRQDRTLADDYYAFINSQSSLDDSASPSS